MPKGALAAATSPDWAMMSSHLSSNLSIHNLPEIIEPDVRVDKLRTFLKKVDSPLVDYSSQMVKTADKYGLDWRLIPAISGAESSFGKFMPKGSFNAYGWNSGAARFLSWEQSFEKVAKVLKEKYIDRGLNTPTKIASIYCHSSVTWIKNVTSFMAQIEATSQEIKYLSVLPTSLVYSSRTIPRL